MTYNKHKKTCKRHNKRSVKQRGGAWYNPFSWGKDQQQQQQQQQPANGQQSTNSIFGTLSNLTNKTEEAFKNAGQGISNATSGLFKPKPQTPRQMNYQGAQMYNNVAASDLPAADTSMPMPTPMPRMIQEREQMANEMPQMGGMPPNLNITYPSWAGTTNVAKPTYWVNDNNQHIQKAGRNKRRSNKRRRNKRRSNKRR